MKIKLVKNLNYKMPKGKEIVVTDDQGNELISQGFAEEIKAKKKVK